MRTQSTCSRRSLCQRERVELSLEVTTLDVAVPLALALNGDAAMFPITTAVEFSPEVDHSDTCHWYMWHRWGAHSKWCTCHYRCT
jgi:hypothetical protein